MFEFSEGQLFSQEVRVRWSDTDASKSIHHTAMLRFFEIAEIEFFRALGFTNYAINELGVDIPRVNVNCDFKAPVQLDEVLDISVSVENVGSTSARLGYTASNESSVIVASGSMTFVSVSLDSGRPVPIPASLREVLELAQRMGDNKTNDN